MATPYSDVLNVFLNKITDYDLPLLDDISKEKILIKYMKTACVKFNKVCLVDLKDIDDSLKQFNQTLDDEMIDIITENMLIEWIKPKVLFTNNLENVLNTKDFNQYSPANQLAQLRGLFKELKDNGKSLINNYSFNYSKPEDLTK